MDISQKILNTILSNSIQKGIKILILHTQQRFIPNMQGWFNRERGVGRVGEDAQRKGKWGQKDCLG